MVQPSVAECNGRLGEQFRDDVPKGLLFLFEEVWTCLRPSYVFKGLAMLVQGSLIAQ